jgi:hypothetical protein
MVRTKTKPFLKRKKVPKFYFHFGQQKKCPPFSFNIYLAMWKYNCEPLWLLLYNVPHLTASKNRYHYLFFLLLSISAHRHLIDNYVLCIRGVKTKFDNVQINVIIIYIGAVWLKLCTVDWYIDVLLENR